jgi:hypothetical protein
LSTTDAQFLIEAFAQSIDADPPDMQVEKRAGSPRAQIEDADCEVPAVALINLLRLNSVAAEPVGGGSGRGRGLSTHIAAADAHPSNKHR